MLQTLTRTMTSSLRLSDPLSVLVKAKYEIAKSTNALTFSETELSIIHTKAGLPFQLRYCPALAKKPTPDKNGDKDKPKGPKPDPFDNPPKDLLIAELPRENSSHVLVLNKYPVIPQHFILATKTNKRQTHELEADDLAMTYACLQAWSDESSPNEQRSTNGARPRLFAFFNSGPHSGASQPHRHLQFVPVEEMGRDVPSSSTTHQGAEWQPLTDLILSSSRRTERRQIDGIEVSSSRDLPFRHFVTPLPLSPPPTGEELQSTYRILLSSAVDMVREYISTQSQHRSSKSVSQHDQNADTQSAHSESTFHDTSTGDVPISYNLAMTREYMAIIPRRAEGCTLTSSSSSSSTIDGDDQGESAEVALNGTVLAGTMMVKGRFEWNSLRQRDGRRGKGDDDGLDMVLGKIGIPWQ